MNVSELKTPEDVLSWARTVECDADRRREGIMYDLEQERRCDNQDIADIIAVALECHRLIHEFKSHMSGARGQMVTDNDIRLCFVDGILKEARERVKNAKAST